MKLQWIVQKVCFFGVADEFVGLNPVISARMSGYYVSSGRRGRVRRLDGRPGAQGGRGTVQCSTRQNERAFLTERRFVALPCGASDGINLLVHCWCQLDRMTELALIVLLVDFQYCTSFCLTYRFRDYMLKLISLFVVFIQVLNV